MNQRKSKSTGANKIDALIIGHTGQDGRILWEQLKAKGYTLVGISRTRIKSHKVKEESRNTKAKRNQAKHYIKKYLPKQIYYLAAHHHSSQDKINNEKNLWKESLKTHVFEFKNVLDAVRAFSPQTQIFYASSSRIYGGSKLEKQREGSKVQPICIYGMTKTAGMHLANVYRSLYGLKISCGILFNHESVFRSNNYISQKIVHGLVAVKRGLIKKVEVGNLNSRVDWGYAPDYTVAMQRILDLDLSSDFIIATGQLHSVRDLAKIVANRLKLNWNKVVVEVPNTVRNGSRGICGDASKLKSATGWKPTVTFKKMIEIMVEHALTKSYRARIFKTPINR